jgi:hypothetical protein
MNQLTFLPAQSGSLASFVRSGVLSLAVIVIWPNQCTAAVSVLQNTVLPKPSIQVRMQPDEHADGGTQITLTVATGSVSANSSALFAASFSTHTSSRLVWRLARKKEAATANYNTAA